MMIIAPEPVATGLRRRGLLVAATTTLLLPFAPLVRAQDATRQLDVPYVPTPMETVRKMLDMGKVDRNDIVYDLGCGDGRIVIAAAKERGARGVGIDLNPRRIEEANENAKSAGVTDRVKFMVGDLFEADFSPATVVTLYLLPDVNLKLRPQLWRQLKPGTRVVSHSFDMGPEWPPESTETVGYATVHQWTITKQNKQAVTRQPRG
jgi:ubiquinone/menaquinone biosynthesis C-methylase UbiE